MSDASLSVCGVNCHKKCEKFMPNLCGVNQKLFAEVLSQVKKTGDERRPSISPEKGVRLGAKFSVIDSVANYSENISDSSDCPNASVNIVCQIKL
ncbi:hypothetical protein DPMN_122302 [Dreissena polymorpha]|uniref:Uncharacterized protein n=1 Tax=Dreissena polymorpha TaxID=45954 RepID=A0A9D4GRM7_DREPO|nr:hypothetical protein DPMN_122302 [Dreissena polymorpha]